MFPINESQKISWDVFLKLWKRASWFWKEMDGNMRMFWKEAIDDSENIERKLVPVVLSNRSKSDHLRSHRIKRVPVIENHDAW